MSELLIYLGKSVIIQAVLLIFYLLILKRSYRHAWNRVFLLAALVVSFIIPSIEIPKELPVQTWENSPVVHWVSSTVTEFDLVPVIVEKEESFSAGHLLILMYLLVAFVFIARSLIHLFFLQKLKNCSEYVKKYWFNLFKTSHSRPFSFFSNVFIPKELFGTRAFDQILAHECVHVKQRHSIDRLLMDFLVSLFWFNPFIYLYRNALIEIHEYQADEAVIDQFDDPIGYQEILYDQLQNASYSGLVSHFNFSMIKKRIVMMNKQKNKYAGWLYMITFPVLVSVFFAFSSKEAVEPMEKAGSELAELLLPNPDASLKFFDLSKAVQENSTPSILPLKNMEKVRLTSSFGNRIDPIDKEEKHHNGIDFATAIGNEVISTADGEVVFAGTDGRHGNRVKIKHGEVYATSYSHLDAIKVQSGQKVKQGEVIALSGNSGASTAPHLHYSVLKNGLFVNPVLYIKNYNFKAKARLEAERERERAESERALAEKEMAMAKEAAERAKIEELRARELEKSASELEAEAYRLRKEAEERRMLEENEARKKEKDKQKSKSKNKSKSNQQALRVIVDPGHGGKDPGAESPDGHTEKEIALAIAKKVRDNFSSDQVIEIILTRDADEFLPLSERASMTSSAVLFLSIHTDNYSEKGSFVLPVYSDVMDFSNDSQIFANLLSTEFEKIGKKTKVGYSSGYTVLNKSECPAVLLNVGYFSDPDEEAFLESDAGQKQVADQISSAIKLAVL